MSATTADWSGIDGIGVRALRRPPPDRAQRVADASGAACWSAAEIGVPASSSAGGRPRKRSRPISVVEEAGGLVGEQPAAREAALQQVGAGREPLEGDRVRLDPVQRVAASRSLRRPPRRAASRTGSCRASARCRSRARSGDPWRPTRPCACSRGTPCRAASNIGCERVEPGVVDGRAPLLGRARRDRLLVGLHLRVVVRVGRSRPSPSSPAPANFDRRTRRRDRRRRAAVRGFVRRCRRAGRRAGRAGTRR